MSPGRTRERPEAGAEVKFYDQTLTGPQYAGLSRENILHQALVVWSGQRPGHLMRTVDNLGTQYMEKLAGHRDTFMVYINGQVFLPCELAKVKGKVVGYISDTMGVIQCQDEDRNQVNVFFHVDDVLVFKKPLGTWEQRFHCAPERLLPVGLYVSVDARSTQHQLLPKDELERTKGEVVFTRRNTEEIKDGEDHELWRQQFTDQPRRPRGRERHRDVKTLFRAPPVRKFKGKRELDDSSSFIGSKPKSRLNMTRWTRTGEPPV